MTPEQFQSLKPGDIVRHSGTGNAYVVIEAFGSRATAVRNADLTNPQEWEIPSNPDHSELPLPAGTPGSRTTYTVEITEREKEACQRRYFQMPTVTYTPEYVQGDNALVASVLRKIALLPKKVLDPLEGKPPVP